jgi:hypothetical protein
VVIACTEHFTKEVVIVYVIVPYVPHGILDTGIGRVGLIDFLLKDLAAFNTGAHKAKERGKDEPSDNKDNESRGECLPLLTLY